MKKIMMYMFSALLIAAFSIFWISCGGSGGGSSSGGSTSGTVALYATDTPDDDYSQVVLTMNSVQLLHTGTGETCDILATPVIIDISDLSSVLELLSITSCPAENYNRIHIEFDKQATLTDISDPPVTAGCTLESYKIKNNKSNTLNCTGDVCSIDMTGAVNVLGNRDNTLALDFELKDFEVALFNTPDCSLTMKVSPLNASGIKEKHDNNYDDEISGKISDLDTTAASFTLKSKGRTYSVSYSGALGEGTDDILTLAETDNLKVHVDINSIDLDAHNIEASGISVKAEGTVSVLDTFGKTFTLSYNTRNITVEYNSAVVIEGTISNGVTVEAVLNGYSIVSSEYSALKIEVGEADDEN